VFCKGYRYFIVLRFIQAIGSCAATVASVSMVRDLFPVRDIPKVFSLLMLVVGLSPMLAPTVGIRYSSLWLAYGFLNFDVYWNCNSICSPIGLPNSYVPDSSISLKPKPILLNFATVLKEPQFYICLYRIYCLFVLLPHTIYGHLQGRR
jgi:DHA1 family bicyclomycin/chloramphenicol resistance-like MFS transporter